MCGGYVLRVLCAAVLALFCMTASASAADPTFSAHGSVEQVYVTGLAPNEQMSLVNGAGTTVATQQADPQGGLLFRNVAPGSGYRVTLAAGGTVSDTLTVLSTQSAPPSTDVYYQSITSSGYDYLTSLDVTKLAFDPHPPHNVTNA